MLMIAIGDEHIGDFRHLPGTLRGDCGQDAVEFVMSHPRGEEGLTVRPLLHLAVAFRVILRERPSRRSGKGGHIPFHLRGEASVEHAANG